MHCWCSTQPTPSTSSATITRPASSSLRPAKTWSCAGHSPRSTGSPRWLGWLYGPAPIVDALNRIRGPFNVSAPAIAAGIAAIEDSAHVERSRAHNTRWIAWLTEEIGKLGLRVTPSVANFVLIHFPTTAGRAAKDADAFLTHRGLILRQVGAYKLPNALRMSVGSEEANRLVVKALSEFLGSGR